jgi:hypothetical protein
MGQRPKQKPAAPRKSLFGWIRNLYAAGEKYRRVPMVLAPLMLIGGFFLVGDWINANLDDSRADLIFWTFVGGAALTLALGLQRVLSTRFYKNLLDEEVRKKGRKWLPFKRAVVTTLELTAASALLISSYLSLEITDCAPEKADWYCEIPQPFPRAPPPGPLPGSDESPPVEPGAATPEGGAEAPPPEDG